MQSGLAWNTSSLHVHKALVDLDTPKTFLGLTSLFSKVAITLLIMNWARIKHESEINQYRSPSRMSLYSKLGILRQGKSMSFPVQFNVLIYNQEHNGKFELLRLTVCVASLAYFRRWFNCNINSDALIFHRLTPLWVASRDKTPFPKKHNVKLKMSVRRNEWTSTKKKKLFTVRTFLLVTAEELFRGWNICGPKALLFLRGKQISVLGFFQLHKNREYRTLATNAFFKRQAIELVFFWQANQF